LALASRAKAFPKRRPTPNGEDNPDHRAFPTFSSGDEREFLGRSVRADATGVATVFRAAVGTGARPVFRSGALRTTARAAAHLSQRLLRAGFRDPLGDHSAPHCAHPPEELSAGGVAAISAAGRRSLAVDPGSVFAGISTRQVGRVVAPSREKA